MFRGVLVILAKIQDITDMKFVLKKNIVLKTKTNLHSVNQKTSKGKKMKRKEMNKGTCAVKKKNCIEKFETQNLRRGIVALVLVENTEVTNKDEGKT